MNALEKVKLPSLQLKRYSWVVAVAWTIIIVASLMWHIVDTKQGILEQAKIQARATYEKDIIYRRWNAGHGGVYVPVTNETLPNPHLSHIPERDITTPSGKLLTLMNPAYMTRQVHELEKQKLGVRGHITSLNPIRPENAPDSWETIALHAFERGEIEISSVEKLEGREYMRLMSPLITEKGCLKCHAKQGYRVGDIRGGISISIPMDSFIAVERGHILTFTLVCVLLWIAGMSGIGLAAQRLIQTEQKRKQAEEELQKAHDELERKVEERTAELSKANILLQQEITERKQAEKAIKRLMRQNELILNSAGEGILGLDQYGNHIFVNPSAAKMLGYEVGELIGKNSHTIWHHSKANGSPYPAEECLICRAYKDGVSHTVDTEVFWKKDGTSFPVKYISTPIIGDGNIIGAVIAFTDITEIKQAEKALKYHEELLNETGKITKVGGWEFDPVSLKGTWTDEVARIHELDPRAETNAELGLSFYHGESRIKIETAVREAIEIGKPYDLELEIITAKGNHKWVRTIGHPIIEDGRVVKVRGSFQDITERKQVEEELRKYREHLEELVRERTEELENANRELEFLNSELIQRRQEAEMSKLQAISANKAKSDFLANMSHELRTPLNSIIGFSEILQDEMYGKLNEKQKEYINDIVGSGRHLLNLINEILDLSKVESGKMELELTRFLLRNVLDVSMSMLKEKAVKHGIKLSLDIEPDADIEIEADERKLKQIMFNLLSNAVKFTPEGGSVHVAARRVTMHDTGYTIQEGQIPPIPPLLKGGEGGLSDFIEISVEDTGIGIKPEDMDKLFKGFSQLETPYEKKYEGTGLGLALTKKFVELHGGKIWAESEYGKGSKFTFVIPIE
ncbi:MAG: ATP-binding protein [Nitrospirota bacterium]